MADSEYCPAVVILNEKSASAPTQRPHDVPTDIWTETRDLPVLTNIARLVDIFMATSIKRGHGH